MPHPVWSSVLVVCLKEESLRWQSWWNGLSLTGSLFSRWSCTLGPGNLVAVECLLSYTALAKSAVKTKIILFISVTKNKKKKVGKQSWLGQSILILVFCFVCFLTDSPENLFLVPSFLADCFCSQNTEHQASCHCHY